MRSLLLVLLAMALFAMSPLVAQQSDVPQGPITLEIVYYEFPQPPPTSCVAYSFNLTEAKDVSPGGQDCCTRDDTIEVYLDGCWVGTIDSRNGEPYTHPFTRVGPVTALPGQHAVAYCNTVSDTPGPSGWFLDNLTPPPDDGLSEPTGTNACRSVQLAVIAAVDDESKYRNHGAYVSAATKALKDTGIPVSEACQSCIINQFARSVPQENMRPCCGL